MHRSATHSPRARQKLLEVVVLLTEAQEKRASAAAAWATAEDLGGSAQALRAEGAQARRHCRALLREAAALVARAERLVVDAREGFEPGDIESFADSV